MGGRRRRENAGDAASTTITLTTGAIKFSPQIGELKCLDAYRSDPRRGISLSPGLTPDHLWIVLCWCAGLLAPVETRTPCLFYCANAICGDRRLVSPSCRPLSEFVVFSRRCLNLHISSICTCLSLRHCPPIDPNMPFERELPFISVTLKAESCAVTEARLTSEFRRNPYARAVLLVSMARFRTDRRGQEALLTEAASFLRHVLYARSSVNPALRLRR